MYSYLSNPINKKNLSFQIEDGDDNFLVMFDGSIVAIKTELVKPLRERVLANYLGYKKDDEKVKLDSMENLILVSAYLCIQEELSEDKSDPDWEPDEDYDDE